MAFAFDTSGVVPFDGGTLGVLSWDGLAQIGGAFAQDYVEAMFKSVMAEDGGPVYVDQKTGARHCAHVFRFADIAPETMADIIADCDAAYEVRGSDGYQATGAEFWMVRQSGCLSGFPPVTITLGEDGKVRFAG